MSSENKTVRIVVIAFSLAAVVLGLLVWQLFTGFDAGSKLFEALWVTAPSTTLHAGESTQLRVRKKKALFFLRDVARPDKTIYFTTSESMLVIEPDGRATCIGTHGEPEESVWASADNGPDHGHLSLNLLPGGPGPTLDFVADVPKPATIPDYFARYAPCCIGDPIIMKEGQAIRYKLVRHGSPDDDVTAKATYTLFFGSGAPNDAHPSIVTGGKDYTTSQNFRVDLQKGTITPPPSIGRNNYDRVVVFARYGELVGWAYIVITHAEEDGREGHIRLHPDER